MKRSKLRIVICVIFSVMGIWNLFSGIYNKIILDKFDKNAVKIEAEVVGSSEGVTVSTRTKRGVGRFDSRTIYRGYNVYVKYEIDGKQYSDILVEGLQSYHAAGSNVKVYYSKKEPDYVRMYVGEGNKFLIKDLILAIIYMLIAIKLYGIKSRKKYNTKVTQKRNSLINSGIMIEGEIFDVTTNEKRGKKEYFANCKAYDANTDTYMIFKSNALINDPRIYGLSKVNVYVNPNDCSDYYVDIEKYF